MRLSRRPGPSTGLQSGGGGVDDRWDAEIFQRTCAVSPRAAWLRRDARVVDGSFELVSLARVCHDGNHAAVRVGSRASPGGPRSVSAVAPVRVLLNLFWRCHVVREAGAALA